VDFSLSMILGLVFRWMHILAAITAVGGTIFIRFALLPCMAEMPEEQRKSLHQALRSRWSRAVMLSIAFLLISGFYNFIYVIIPALRVEGTAVQAIKPFYHGVFGVKFLLAIGIFFIASAMVGRSSAFEKIRANARRWATVNVVLAVILVCLSGFLRVARDGAMAKQPPSETRGSTTP